jgi:hypothetical protein
MMDNKIQIAKKKKFIPLNVNYAINIIVGNIDYQNNTIALW